MKNLLSILAIGGSVIASSNVYAQSADKPAFQGFYAGIRCRIK